MNWMHRNNGVKARSGFFLFGAGLNIAILEVGMLSVILMEAGCTSKPQPSSDSRVAKIGSKSIERREDKVGMTSKSCRDTNPRRSRDKKNTSDGKNSGVDKQHKKGKDENKDEPENEEEDDLEVFRESLNIVIKVLTTWWGGDFLTDLLN
ncbi:hypothetical protein NECID01_0728 [Nematocida sp. AWRm77]|nr:hypothetical protein NECID01_0728 [Nematocida sp. AWRm77]